MATITAGNVRGVFARFVRAAQALGMNTAGWAMIEGSRSDGIGWSLVMADRSLGIGRDGNFLGMTEDDAYHALNYMARAWEIAAAFRTEQDRTAEAISAATSGHTDSSA